ncbi:MAG TPA: glycosyltransferase family 2 protein [Tepidisphaeraceae bacterium]|nr:glycosyltransferase family 2 protein [Tepidisphaeraceae bacterium]
MPDPFFSVVIPTYNRAHLLRGAVDSVLAQEDTDFELIVVDDGSTDNTAEALAGYGARVRLLRQENRGPGPARNLGIRAAKGRYIAFLDSDDRWFPWTLRVYRQVALTHGGPAIMVASVAYFDESASFDRLLASQLSASTREPRVALFGDYLETARAQLYRGTGVSCFLATALQSAGGLVELPIYNEDLDLLLRLGTSGTLAHIEAPLGIALFRHAAGSLSDLDRTYRGTRYLIAQEHQGAYPGGSARRRQRIEILSHQTRSFSWISLARGRTRLGIDIYRRSFIWNVRQRRIRYLVGYWLYALVPSMRRRLNRAYGGV